MAGFINTPAENRAAVRDTVAHCKTPKTGVLLVNLGTPDAPDTPSLRRYLREFLSDRRVIETPRAIWWLILYGIILPFRSPRSAKAYQRVWTEQGSPLLTLCRALADKLQADLRQTSPQISVLLAMNYGRPSIDQAVDRLRRENIQRLLVVPMYPQYSATTTASVFDRVTNSLQRLRWLPEVRFINDYHHDEDWQKAIADSVRRFQKDKGQPEKLVFSFHGIPKQYLLDGDPYYCQCRASARQVAARLGLADDDWICTFQSRLGRAEWLKPYTDVTLEQMAKNGTRNVQVVCPGFSVDCLETIDEIAFENREEFIEAGGEALDYIPCLNDSDMHVKVLAGLCHRHGQGWPEFAGGRAVAASDLEQRVERADHAAQQLGLD
ncbi:ferrochelatase [Wenzhouxiangella sp. AB-CW3]|uniref:ferrochelatase n=1 Tax=Wenzhouxiangella sp. AB-CW3 TaxID=2771012 RepID=UPI00168BB6B9|nr:ferrochelatase [Wenzhouxiangella sp. AB-CW3]QOC22319.1 ferrochelatase [Wenzhouxiangella sp. AB-CW3]